MQWELEKVSSKPEKLLGYNSSSKTLLDVHGVFGIIILLLTTPGVVWCSSGFGSACGPSRGFGRVWGGGGGYVQSVKQNPGS